VSITIMKPHKYWTFLLRPAKDKAALWLAEFQPEMGV